MERYTCSSQTIEEGVWYSIQVGNSKTLKIRNFKIYVLKFKNLFSMQLENNFEKKKNQFFFFLSVFKYLGVFEFRFAILGIPNISFEF